MKQSMKIAVYATALVLLITGSRFAYNALRGRVDPEILISQQPVSISASSDETVKTDENVEPELMKAPDFTVEDFGDNNVKLSDFEGKPVVLNFWASWCPPCKAEMPEFNSVYTDMGGEVTFMMINLTDGQRETKKKGSEYVSEQGFSFPVYYDTKQEGAYAYGIRSIPTTIFIDSNGYIVTGVEGQLDEKTLRYGISLILPENTTKDADIMP